MQLTRSLPLVAATVLLAAQAGLKAGTTMVVVPSFSSAVAQTQTPPSVTFQVEVNYVDVDAIVTDEKGNFVTGLTREDFEVFEDGKPQKVEMFSYVELPVERPDRFAVLGRPVTTDVRSNARPFDGRVYVLVLDDVDISPLRTSIVKKSAREFIERHFGANDLAAVVYTSGRTDATQDFTNDRDLLIASVDKFVGRRLQSAAIEALEKHYYREFDAARSAGQRSRNRDRHQRHSDRPSACWISSASSVRWRCSTRSATSASSSPASGAGERPCCCSARAWNCR